MRKHINLMQNPEDIIFDKDGSYSKEFLIQALANLGQRIGIKGDGIAYKSFNFNDILLDSYSSDENVGYIEYIKDDNSNQIKALFGVANKNNLEDSQTLFDSININNTLNFNAELSFSIPVCGIEKYSKSSICINNNNELTFMLAGKRLGYNDNDENNTVLMYYKFNILTNKLISCYKIFQYYKDQKGTNYYCLLNVDSVKNQNNEYVLSVDIFNPSDKFKNFDNSLINYENEFIELFKFNNYTNSSLIPFSIIDANYESIDKLLEFDENNLEFNSAISLILNIPEGSLYTSKSINLVFDTSKNELLSNENFEDAKEFYNKEYQFNLNEELFNINEDINKLYVNIFNYYNEKFYLENRATLIKRILIKIYEKSIDFKTLLGKRLYIPLDYEFHYICNSNDELDIYYSNNIYITYTSLSNVNLSEFWDLNNNLVFDYNDLNKLKVYNFEVNYNTYIDNLINSINIKDIYTMPYINAANNWCINDSDTKIKAVGKDAGNPNIIIIYNKDTNNQNSYNILNVISNKEKILTAEYTQQWFNVHPALFENVYDIDIECCAYIPKVDSLNYEYFKDSIILSISDLNCLRYEEYKDKYKGSYILTLWHIIDGDELKFECINQLDSNDKYALALGSTINILNELSDSSIANLNSQDLILLKSIISNVAHERLDVSMNNWLIIKNKQSEEYVNNTNDYNNDLNMIVQYDDNVSIKSNHIIHSHSNSRYISDINNVSITNSLYPKYIRYEETIEVVPEQISYIIGGLQRIVSSRESTILVNGTKIENIESLIEKLKAQSTTISRTINTETINTIKSYSYQKSNSNYYEYIFNNNVPTLDYKEIFNRNFNLLNRLNIVSLDNNGKLYNAYIGTSYDEIDKSTLHIGTSSLNINLGSDTLMNEKDKDQFNTHNTLSIDFENIKLNAEKNIEFSKEPNYTHTIGNTSFKVSSFKLIDTINSNLILNENDTYSVTSINSSLFSKLYISDTNVNYYLCVNTLMNKMNIDLSKYEVTVNFNKEQINPIVYTANDNSTTNMYYIQMNDAQIYELNINNGILYSAYSVEVMYYESSYTNEHNNFINKINIYLSFK